MRLQVPGGSAREVLRCGGGEAGLLSQHAGAADFVELILAYQREGGRPRVHSCPQAEPDFIAKQWARTFDLHPQPAGPLGSEPAAAAAPQPESPARQPGKADTRSAMDTAPLPRQSVKRAVKGLLQAAGLGV